MERNINSFLEKAREGDSSEREIEMEIENTRNVIVEEKLTDQETDKESEEEREEGEIDENKNIVERGKTEKVKEKKSKIK